jgi:hypothetical protein
MKIISLIDNPAVIKRILRHLKLRDQPKFQSPSRTGLSPSRRDISADHPGQPMLFSHQPPEAISYSYAILSPHRKAISYP